MSDPTNPHDPTPGGETPGRAAGPPPPPPGAAGGPPPPPPGAYQDPVQQPPVGGYQQPAPPVGGYEQPAQPTSGYRQPAQPYFQQPAAPAAGGVGRPGELMDRFFARLIDYVILFAVNILVVSFVVIGMLLNQSTGAFGVGGSYVGNVVGAVLGAALYLGYFAYLESSRGQTLGKMLLKLETRGAGGGRPTMEEAVKRNIWVVFGLLSIIPLVGGLVSGLAQLAAVIFIAVGISGDAVARRGWHDTFAGTQVVKVG